MAKKIERKEIIEDDIFNPFIAGAEQADIALNKLFDTIKEGAKAGKKASESIKLDKDLAKAIGEIDNETKKLEANRNKLIKTENKLKKVREQLLKLKEETGKAEEKELKGKIRLQKSNTAQRKALKNQIELQEQFGVTIKNTADLLENLNVIEQREITTIGEARNARRELQKQVDLLNTAIPEEADAIVRLNAVINKNTEFIKENVDQNRVQAETVGDYKNQINEAIEETGAFDAILGKLDGTAATIVGAIQGVVGRLKEQTEATKAVGDETKKTGRAIGRFNKTLKASIIGIIIVALTAMVAAFTKSREGARELAILTAQLSNTLELLGKRLLEIGKAIVNVYVTAANFAIRTTKELKLVVLEIVNIKIPENFLTEKLGLDGFTLASEEAKKELQDLKKELAESPDTEISDVLKAIGNIITTSIDAFSDFDKAFINTNSRIRKMLELQDRLIDQNAIREKQVAELLALQEKQQAVADDDTRSLIEQEKAQRQVLVTQSLRLKIQQEIAESELDFALLSIKNDLERAGILKEFNDDQLKSLEFLKDVNAADQVKLESLDRLKQATIALIEVEGEQVSTALEAGTVLNKIRRDQFEQQLDFAIDAFDNVKSLNEQLIADTTRESKERFKILAETNRLNKESFEDQVKLTEDFVRISIEERLRLANVNENIDEEEIKRLSEQLILSGQLDIEALSALKSQRDVRAELNRLGVTDEIVNVRILEIIRERKIATQDLAIAERDLIRELEMSEQDLQTFRRDLAVTFAEEETERRTKDFEEAGRFSFLKLDAAKEAIELEKEARLSVVELEEDLLEQAASNESERTRIAEEADEKRRQIRKDSLEKEVELQREANEQILKLSSAAIDLLINTERKRSEERLANIDAELSALQAQKVKLQEDEEEGIADAKDNVAINEQLLAEAEAKRAEELRRAERREERLTLLKLIQAKAEQGSANPFAEAALEILATRSFKDGTDDTGTVLNGLDRDGGRVTITHDNEMIVDKNTADNWRGMGYKTRDKITEGLMRADNFRTVEIEQAHASLQEPTASMNPKELFKRMDSLERAIMNAPKNAPSYKPIYDPMSKTFIEIVKQGNTTDIYKTKVGGGGITGS